MKCQGYKNDTQTNDARVNSERASKTDALVHQARERSGSFAVLTYEMYCVYLTDLCQNSICCSDDETPKLSWEVLLRIGKFIPK